MLDSLIKMVVYGSLSAVKVSLSIEQVPNLLLVFLNNTTLDNIKRGWGRVPKMRMMKRKLIKSGRHG